MLLRILIALTLLASSVSENVQIHGWINEFHYRNFQDDWKQFIEIIGPIGQEAYDYLLVMYQGRDGSQFDEGISLSGETFVSEKNATGHEVGGDFGYIVHDFHHEHGNIRKGKVHGDGLALVFQGVCIQFICYGDHNIEVFTATTGPCSGQTCTNIGAHEGRANPIGHSLQMEGTGRHMEDFTWHPVPILWSPNAHNSLQTLLS
jgi:hypothetical protein